MKGRGRTTKKVSPPSPKKNPSIEVCLISERGLGRQGVWEGKTVIRNGAKKGLRVERHGGGGHDNVKRTIPTNSQGEHVEIWEGGHREKTLRPIDDQVGGTHGKNKMRWGIQPHGGD